jgi:hypothetical protein
MADETISLPDTAAPPAPVPAPTPATSEESLLTAEAAEPAAPEPQAPAYGEFKLPDGSAIDPAALEQARALFAEAKLPHEQAQKFIDLAVSREQAAATRSVQAFVDLQTKWVSEIKADPEIGGNRFTASMAAAGRAIDRLGVPGLKEALNLTGAGNNPAIVKAFVRLGQMVSEDRFMPGLAAAPAAPRSPAETIYDGNPKQSQ